MAVETAPAVKMDWRGHGLPALADLDGLSGDELTALMARLYGKAPVGRMSRELMIRAVAFGVQLAREGRPMKSDRSSSRSRDLRKSARRVEQACRSGSVVKPVGSLSPGTRLVREWRGEVFEVVVQADHTFLYQGRAWRSLSEIARTITGTAWSGPRFFGLRQNANA